MSDLFSFVSARSSVSFSELLDKGRRITTPAASKRSERIVAGIPKFLPWKFQRMEDPVNPSTPAIASKGPSNLTSKFFMDGLWRVQARRCELNRDLGGPLSILTERVPLACTNFAYAQDVEDL